MKDVLNNDVPVTTKYITGWQNGYFGWKKEGKLVSCEVW